MINGLWVLFNLFYGYIIYIYTRKTKNMILTTTIESHHINTNILDQDDFMMRSLLKG